LLVKLKDVFDSNDVINENLKNLKHLDILGWTQKFGSTTYWINVDYVPNFLRNFDQLVSSLKRLECLHLPIFTFSQDREFKIQSPVVSLLQRNRESLRELSLHFEMWDDILPVTLPCLTSLSATVAYFNQQDSLRDFLASNASKDCFKELDVAVRIVYEFGSNLFDPIRQLSPCLKKLHLQAYQFVDEDGNEVRIDWTFLGEIKHLKDFQLARPRIHVRNWDLSGTGTLLLGSLPRNQLKRLGL